MSVHWWRRKTGHKIRRRRRRGKNSTAAWLVSRRLRLDGNSTR